jgi:beta-glucanase (GH16 family)
MCSISNVYAQCNGKLIFYDEFNGSSLDTSKWTYAIGNGCPINCGWGNNEREYYTSDTANVFLKDGNLVLRALYKPNYENSGSDFTSGKVTTQGKFDHKYGRYEARMKLSTGRGTWPAFWLLPTKNEYGPWPTSGEIDIMEFQGHDPYTVSGTVHYGNLWPNNKYDGNVYSVLDSAFNESFHTFALEWDSISMRFFVDNHLFKTEVKNPSSLKPLSNNAVKWPWDKEFFMILNLAIGGNLSGNLSTAQILAETTFPQSILIDYVRVYDMDTSFSSTLQTPYDGKPIAIPGKIQAEHYNHGCNGVAYYDADNGNKSTKFRTDGVDIETCYDVDGGFDVNNIADGEWLNYDVDVASEGDYVFTFRVATNQTGKYFRVESNGQVIIDTVLVANTGSMVTWRNVAKMAKLKAGQQTLKLNFNKGLFNLNFINITPFDPNGIADDDIYSDIDIYPNPLTGDELLVSGCRLSAEDQIQIVDIFGGQKQFPKLINDHQLFIEEALPQGVYFLVIKTKTGLFRAKFVK